jgi:hypothetical protein
MKTYAIQWKSSITGTAGIGTKLFEKEEAESLAAELNEHFPEIHHLAVIPPPTSAEPAPQQPAQPTGDLAAVTEFRIKLGS